MHRRHNLMDEHRTKVIISKYPVLFGFMSFPYFVFFSQSLFFPSNFSQSRTFNSMHYIFILYTYINSIHFRSALSVSIYLSIVGLNHFHYLLVHKYMRIGQSTISQFCFCRSLLFYFRYFLFIHQIHTYSYLRTQCAVVVQLLSTIIIHSSLRSGTPNW